jgi:hypothetical protein
MLLLIALASGLAPFNRVPIGSFQLHTGRLGFRKSFGRSNAQNPECVAHLHFAGYNPDCVE